MDAPNEESLWALDLSRASFTRTLNAVLPTSKPDRSASRLWAVGLTLSWLPSLLGLLARARLALDGAWWGQFAGLAPASVFLRDFWFVMIPVGLVALSIAAVLVLCGGRRRLLIAVGFLFLMALMNLVEFLFLLTLQSEFAQALGNGMGISPSEIRPFEPGLVAMTTDFTVKVISITVIVFGRLPRYPRQADVPK